MKNTTKHITLYSIIAAFGLASTAHAQIVLASWDAWNGATSGGAILNVAANSTATGISAFAGGNVDPDFTGQGGGFGVLGFGSTDGTFGNLGSPEADTTAYGSNTRINLQPNTTNTNRLDFSITNNTGFDVELDSFYYDYDPRGNGSLLVQLNHLNLEIGTSGDFTSDLTDANGTISGFNSATGATSGDFYDATISLSNALTDNVLANGESAAFRIQLPTGDGTTAFAIDNVAITGTVVVPEPSATALMAGALCLGLVLYRRQRIR